jgi:hypothetical protein
MSDHFFLDLVWFYFGGALCFSRLRLLWVRGCLMACLTRTRSVENCPKTMPFSLYLRLLFAPPPISFPLVSIAMFLLGFRLRKPEMHARAHPFWEFYVNLSIRIHCGGVSTEFPAANSVVLLFSIEALNRAPVYARGPLVLLLSWLDSLN